MVTQKSITGSVDTGLHIRQRQLCQLKRDPANARIHKPNQINLLAKSIKAFGFNIPIVVDDKNTVIAGHARLEAAKKLGLLQVPTISLDHLSPDQIKAFAIADNRLAEISAWDEKKLAIQITELASLDLSFDIQATGFNIGEIDLQVESLKNKPPEQAVEADVPLVQGTAVTKLHDLWLLGKHRLLCGNALEPASFEKLMTGKMAGMVITDPPYNVKVQGHVGGKGHIKHREFSMASGEMSEKEFTQFLMNTFKLLVTHSKKGSIHIVFIDWRHLSEILTAGTICYSALLNMCVWVKNQAGMGSLYRSQHELALIYKNGKASHQNNVQLGRFGRHRSNVWNYGGIQAMRNTEEGNLLAMHPTVKPTQMIADAILDVSKPNSIILDPFLGSGTTLLACQRVNRTCYGMELDPVYLDTAIRRWQLLTGEDAINASTGQTFTEHMQLAQQSDETDTALATKYVESK